MERITLPGDAMIHYAINSKMREPFYFIAAISAIAVVGVIPVVYFGGNYSLKTPSAFSVFFVILWAHDEFLWKLPLFRLLHKIPNLNGVYEVRGVAKGKTAGDGDVPWVLPGRIIQTFTRIQIEIQRSTSKSQAISASFDLSTPGSYVLKYAYSHIPTFASTDPLENHLNRGDGFQTLFLSEKELGGPYFSDWQRTGNVKFVKKE